LNETQKKRASPPNARPPAPDFELPATGGTNFRLSSAKGKPSFSTSTPKTTPRAAPPKASSFRDLYPQFQTLGCAVYGLSRDSIKSHENFKARMHFPFDLLSDADEKACKLFDVIKMKNMYGRKVRGIERSTFAIDSGGIVRREWRGVKVPDHVQEVLDFVKTLK
jgi:peroxiredoxin Q/BCP